MSSLPPILRTAIASRPQQSSSDPSLMQRIAGNVLSPLAIAGNVLDLPGSTVRDVLAGENPFDQWMTPTTSENRTGGRDLLTRYGLTAPNDPHRWELSDLAGFGAELATDPLTFVSGIGRGLGTALRGTGKATDLFKVGVPFTGKSVGVNPFGATQMLDSAAKKVWDTDAGKYAAQAGSMVFDPAVKGRFRAAEQDVARRMTQSTESTAADAALRGLDDIEQAKPVYESFLKEFGSIPADQTDKTWKQILQHAQETAPSGDYAKSFEDAVTRFAGNAPSASLTAQAKPFLESWVKGRADDVAAVRERGGRVGDISGKVSYGPRSATEQYATSRKEDLSGGGLLSTPHMKHRQELIATIPQADIDVMLKNRSRYTGQLGAMNIRTDFPQYMGYTNSKGRVINDIAHSNRLRKWLEGVDSSIETVHELSPEKLHIGYREGMDRVARNLDAIHGALADAIDPNGVPLKQAFKAYGMDELPSQQWFAKLTNKSLTEVDKLRVNRETAKAIQSVLKASKNPEWLGVIGEAMDKFNRMFKGAVTLPFPSFHMRNFVSGQHMNLASEHFRGPADYAAYAKAMKEAWKLRSQGTKSHVFKEAVANGMAPDQRALDDVELLAGDNIAPPVFNPVQAGKDAIGQAAKYVADNPQGTWVGGIDKYIPGRVRQAMNVPMQYGSNVARATEFMNRVPMYLYLKGKGLTPKQAAAEVNKLQFDYSKSLTPFEKNVTRRMIPFYSFTKNVVPQIMSMLAERPGGGVAQTIRASVAGRDENTVTPPHIADSAAVPLGELADGTQRYLSNFGLAPEAALPYLTAPADMRGTALNALSSLTPLAKFPLELATGQTFFQRGPSGGRPLTQLDPSVGRTISNVTGADNPVNILGDRGWSRFAEHLLSNSPASKLLTTARQLSDPRKDIGTKAVNTLLPFKITDVSPQQQERAINEASASLADELGARTWSNRYFPKEMIAAVQKTNPEAAKQMIALDNLMRKAKRDAKKFRDEKQAEKKKPARTESDKVVRELMRMAGV